MPAVEGLLTLGLATAVEVHEGHEYELNLWKRIVHLIDPSLLVCDLDGLLFKSRDDLEKHIKMAHQQNNTGMMMAPNDDGWHGPDDHGHVRGGIRRFRARVWWVLDLTVPQIA
ncbi:hypothetical protein [Thermogymnomonas acidicola]|uniref:hypothetical protein n=1 Tax=Thermogymnomonas acidicola TaxID=399579 RepID=UPI0013967E5D|nr:hypothetical protein [Thermogymnomonas acidicola]